MSSAHHSASGMCESEQEQEGNFLLLIHSNTTDTSTVFVDSSNYNRTISRLGCYHSTTQAKFGASSIYFSGVDTSLLVLDVPAFEFQMLPFTIDMWVRPTALSGAHGLITTMKNSVTPRVGLYLCMDTINLRVKFGDIPSYDTTADLAVNVWHHVALVGDANYLYVFLNGVLRFQTARVNIPINSEDLAIGRLFSDMMYYYFTGYIDEIAVRDYAVWTSDFTPSTTMYEN